MLELLVLILLAVPIAAIVGVVMAIGTRDRLRGLEGRLAMLERRLAGMSEVAAPVPPRPAAPQAEPISRPVPDAPSPAMRGAAPSAPPGPRVGGADAAPPAQPASTAPPSRPAPPSMGFEERFGTQWVVWIGGLALALGGFFLVRYSIEQGLIGPGVRVTLGALLALALIAAGEWTRRSEQLSGIAGLPSANIPGTLNAVGTTVAYADVFAAYALYGFLGPAAAFLLLGLVALSTLAAALLHGPALAGLGLVGAEVTPLLVASGTPNYWALYIYLAVMTAVAFGFFWALPGIGDAAAGTLAPHIFHVAVGFGLAVLLIVAGLFYGPA